MMPISGAEIDGAVADASRSLRTSEFRGVAKSDDARPPVVHYERPAKTPVLASVEVVRPTIRTSNRGIHLNGRTLSTSTGLANTACEIRSVSVGSAATSL